MKGFHGGPRAVHSERCLLRYKVRGCETIYLPVSSLFSINKLKGRSLASWNLGAEPLHLRGELSYNLAWALIQQG